LDAVQALTPAPAVVVDPEGLLVADVSVSPLADRAHECLIERVFLTLGRRRVPGGIGESSAADARPTDPPGRIPGDDRMTRHVVGDDRPGTDHG
jgi:hypothetical protein